MISKFKKIKKCRISHDRNLKRILNLGSMSLTGFFPKKKEKVLSTPVEIVFSNQSKLLQLAHTYNSKLLFGSHYGYRSGLNKSMIAHLEDKYFKLKKLTKIKKNDNILDIGSNDGTFLNFFSININRHGCDPTAKKFKRFYDKKIKIYPNLFGNSFVRKAKGKKFKIVSCIAMFYDLDDPLKFCKLVEKILHKDGIFHVEVAYVPDILKTLSFDTFCQEHLTYFSLYSFEYLIKQTNLQIVDYERNSVNGGSINFNLSFKSSRHKPKFKKLESLRSFEKKNKTNELSTYRKFAKKIIQLKKRTQQEIKKLNNKNIYGFGASTKGNVTLQYLGFNKKNMKAIYDINPDKFRSYTPGTNIPIVNEKKIILDKPDYIVFLIWHFKKTILQKFKKLNLKKTKYIWIFPKFLIKNKI